MDEKIEQKVLADLTTVGVETRAGIRPDAVKEYAEILREGGTLDPAVVFLDDNGRLWLASGHHRKAAYEKAGRPRMPCIVKRGSQWDAIEYGIKDNVQHRGERLSLADKRFNVKRCLAERPEMSDRAIGELCGMSPSTVGSCRRRTVQSGQSSDSPALRTGKDGRTIDTSRIGRMPAGCPKCGSDLMSDGEPGNAGHFCPNCDVPEGEPGTFDPPVDLEVPPQPVAEEISKAHWEEVPDWGPVWRGPKPVGNPAELLKEAHRRLAKVIVAVNHLGEHWPGPAWKRVSDGCYEMGERLEAWAEEEMHGTGYPSEVTPALF